MTEERMRQLQHALASHRPVLELALDPATGEYVLRTRHAAGPRDRTTGRRSRQELGRFACLADAAFALGVPDHNPAADRSA